MHRHRPICFWALLVLLSLVAQVSSLDQDPLRAPDSDTSLVTDDDRGAKDQAGAAAKIALYPGSRIYPDDMKALGRTLTGCSVEELAEQVDLELAVCLSGEYYARDNIKVLEPVHCPDGLTPILMFYQNRRCTGTPVKVLRTEDEIISRCLWDEENIPVPSYYWSLIYRCSVDPGTGFGVADDALGHKVAEPRTIIQNSANYLDGVSGLIRGYFDGESACRAGRGCRGPTLPVLPGESYPALDRGELQSIQVARPAICSDGSRAQLKRLEAQGPPGTQSGWRSLDSTLVDGVIDMDDWMLNSCIPMASVLLLNGTVGRSDLSMFHCESEPDLWRSRPMLDAGEVVLQESIRPTVSHIECHRPMRDQWGQEHPRSSSTRRPPTWFYPKIMTCTSLENTQRVIVDERATCPDGTLSRLAMWRGPGCEGMPDVIGSFFPGGSCSPANPGGDWSYMIWCDGERRVDAYGTLLEPAYAQTVEADDPRAVLSFSECSQVGDVEGPKRKGLIRRPIWRAVPNQDCLTVTRWMQMKVYGNARCPDGKEAGVAVWYDPSRCGLALPDRVLDVYECTDVCRDELGCGIRFFCRSY